MKLLKVIALGVAFVLSIVAMASAGKLKKASGLSDDARTAADNAYNASTGIMVLTGAVLLIMVWHMLKGSKYQKYFSLGQYL